MMSKLFTLCLLLVSSDLFAGTMTASVDRNDIATDESLELTLTIIGSLDSEVQIPQQDSFDFQQTGQQKNFSIINGAMSSETVLTYDVRPLKTGTLEIPAFRAKIDGKMTQTLSIKVNVGGSGKPPQQPNQQQSSSVAPEGLFSVSRTTKVKSPFVGQTFAAPIEILSRVRPFRAVNLKKNSQDFRVFSATEEEQTVEQRGGQLYQVIRLVEYLFPQRAGRKPFPEISFDAVYYKQTGGGGFFGMFGLNKEVREKVTSPKQTIEVRELPTQGKDAARFSELVGKFSLKTTLSAQETRVGETVTLTIEMVGNSAFDSMKPLDLSLPVKGRFFKDKPVSEEKVTQGRFEAKWSQKIAFIPGEEFSGSLGPLSLQVFNPETEKYELLEAPLGNLTVKPSLASLGTSTQSVDPERNTAPDVPETPKAPQQPPSTSQSPMQEDGFYITYDAAKIAAGLFLACLIGIFGTWVFGRLRRNSTKTSDSTLTRIEKKIARARTRDDFEKHFSKWLALKSYPQSLTIEERVKLAQQLAKSDIVSEFAARERSKRDHKFSATS